MVRGSQQTANATTIEISMMLILLASEDLYLLSLILSIMLFLFFNRMYICRKFNKEKHIG